MLISDLIARCEQAAARQLPQDLAAATVGVSPADDFGPHNDQQAVEWIKYSERTRTRWDCWVRLRKRWTP